MYKPTAYTPLSGEYTWFFTRRTLKKGVTENRLVPNRMDLRWMLWWLQGCS